MANLEAQRAPSSPTASVTPPAAELDQEQIAELHSHDSSSVAVSRADQPRVLLQAPAMWGLVYVPMLLAATVLGYMVFHLDPGPGRVPGGGDRGSPHAQPGDR